MVVVVFRSRLKPGVETEIEALGTRLYELASRMPGYISYREYLAADGESVAIVEFESLGALQAWREHPEHRAAQAVGKERFLSSYRIQVCTVERDYGSAPA
jgi:heme-degrading monooxygenase HmoA